IRDKLVTGVQTCALPISHRTGLPLVLELRDLWAGDPGLDAGRPLLRRLQARAVARSARIVCMTPEAAARLADLHPEAAERIAVRSEERRVGKESSTWRQP